MAYPAFPASAAPATKILMIVDESGFIGATAL
jgi:hypothetical protein